MADKKSNGGRLLPRLKSFRIGSTRDFLSTLPRSAKRLIMMAFDLALLSVALLTALALTYSEGAIQAQDMTLMLVLAPIITIPVFVKFGLYRAIIRYVEFRMALTVVLSVTVSVVLLTALLGATGIGPFTPRDAFVYWLYLAVRR
jgi:FlaA1/EpsC-like NDP-sugar epimerase